MTFCKPACVLRTSEVMQRHHEIKIVDTFCVYIVVGLHSEPEKRAVLFRL